ncbi:hypothetical protein QM716_01890 [Rhodococcus sp. IEGM 1409]|uniref:hypothetical protein n=1 Tax=Rhodococcus sp. IEGM 1409 TaxID=3047082 RepID=UPI0024B82BE7|nr:hypothetical protein [Rhodococcus sp. IEGM 1409]MDI9898600.1 hypothetical protein [Rhodococcus sp. IEGM 1409]
MRTSTTLAAYAVGLVAVFGAALGVGAAIGSPIDMSTTQHSTHEPTTESMPGMDSTTPAGLEVSSGGYTLTEVTAPDRAGEPGTLAFRILDSNNKPVVDFDLLHEKKLHLIVVRNDTSEFRHVHPSLAADGTWSIDWTWPVAGTYRVFADFDPTDGTQLTLGRNFDVAGEFAPAPLPAKSATATVDGYTVTLDGDLTIAGGPITLSVARDGAPVTDLDPYLGAYGHLVALRTGDLAYLHVHPEGEPGDGVTAPGPDISFHAQAPSEGTYRLFLDFQHEGVVRTAEFTVDAGTSAASVPDNHEGGH